MTTGNAVVSVSWQRPSFDKEGYPSLSRAGWSISVLVLLQRYFFRPPSQPFGWQPSLWSEGQGLLCQKRIDHLFIVLPLNKWSILLDGIIHWNPLPFYFIFVSLSQFPFLLESFDWHVSHHLIPSMTQVSFCATMLHTVTHASFELFFPGQPFLCFAYSFDVVNSFECLLYVS